MLNEEKTLTTTTETNNKTFTDLCLDNIGIFFKELLGASSAPSIPFLIAFSVVFGAIFWLFDLVFLGSFVCKLLFTGAAVFVYVLRPARVARIPLALLLLCYTGWLFDYNILILAGLALTVYIVQTLLSTCGYYITR